MLSKIAPGGKALEHAIRQGAQGGAVGPGPQEAEEVVEAGDFIRRGKGTSLQRAEKASLPRKGILSEIEPKALKRKE